MMWRISYPGVPEKVPSARPGKRIGRSTLYRWVAAGLETIKIRGTTYTSCEALQRFAESSSQAVLATAQAPAADVVKPTRNHERFKAAQNRLADRFKNFH